MEANQGLGEIHGGQVGPLGEINVNGHNSDEEI